MCLVAFELNSAQSSFCFAPYSFAHYSFVLAANRDEYFARPTRAANWWPETTPTLFAGKDLQAGGTWMGLNRHGQFAFVTNFRTGNPPEPGLQSRGAWVLAALQENNSRTEQLQQLMQQSGLGNLVVGNVTDPTSFVYLAHHAGQQAPRLTHLHPACHGISNGSLNDPWPKTTQLKADLHVALTAATTNAARFGWRSAEHTLTMALMSALSRSEKYSEEQLPSTGVSVETERLLSSTWIESETYGTRASTVVLAQKNGRCLFIERSREGVISQTEFTVR